MIVKTQDEIRKEVNEVFQKAGVKYSDEDVLLLMGCAEQFRKSGYTFTHVEVAEFLVSKKNMKMIEEDGIKKTIYAMSRMKLGTITRAKKPGRNEPCECGKMKYKKCKPETCQKQ